MVSGKKIVLSEEEGGEKKFNWAENYFLNSMSVSAPATYFSVINF